MGVEETASGDRGRTRRGLGVLALALGGLATVAGSDSLAARHSQVMLRPATGAPGTVAKLTGRGFPGGRILVATGRRALSVRAADRRGRFAAKLRVPGGRSGLRRLESVGGKRRVTSHFRLRPEGAGDAEVASSTGRRVRWSPLSAPAGAEVRLRGSGFRPREHVVITLFGKAKRLRADSRGTFAAGLIVTGPEGRRAGAVRTGALRLRLIVDVDQTVMPPPAAFPAPLVPDPVIAGAGDIAASGSSAESTAKLLDEINPDVVYTTGDHAYPAGAAADYASWYEPTWGRHKAKTRPTPGNHDYVQPGAGPYFDYFGAQAGERDKGYYAYNLGAWRLYALNSSVSMSAGSPQEAWLRTDLFVNRSPCVLAYWHHPRFSAGNYGDSDKSDPIWKTLYAAGAELVMNGHDHNYQRYAPMRPDGSVDYAHGIREFVVGTGGNRHYPLMARTDGSREAADGDTFGVLKLTLRADGYNWQFIPEAGRIFTDGGSGTCH